MEASRPTNEDFAPAIEFGIVSVCLGTIGLMLFFLPILSIPLALCGLLAGVGGIIRGVYRGRAGLRWSLIGCTLCTAVAILGVILAYAPIGETPARAAPPQSWSPPYVPYVAPPAPPRP